VGEHCVCKVNTKTQLITFLIFALLVNKWQLTILLLLMPLFLAVLIYVHNRHYFHLTYRLKWFYLVMFGIFACNTPGEHVFIGTFVLKLTYEGLLMGLEQVLRIATLLALLSLILMQNTKQQLISGIYFLMQPLAYCGIDLKCFAARLWLTLHYVELQQPSAKKQSLTGGILQYLHHEVSEAQDVDIAIELDNPRYTRADYLLLVAMCVLLVMTVYLGL
jgi:energy-coupling factor transporter transmembrane protein EcfT